MGDPGRISFNRETATIRVFVAALSATEAGALVQFAMRRACEEITHRAQLRRFRLPYRMKFAETDSSDPVPNLDPLYRALESGASPASCYMVMADRRDRRAAVRIEVIGIPEIVATVGEPESL